MSYVLRFTATYRHREGSWIGRRQHIIANISWWPGSPDHRHCVKRVGGRIWLRATADIGPGSGRQARFSYSTDGTTFTSLGPAFTMNNAWQFFMGYRYGIFNYATQALGGAIDVKRFSLAAP